MDFVELIGFFGATLILAGFLLRTSKKYGVGTVFYLLLNIFGAGVLIWYSFETGAWPFVLLNVVWVFDALRSLFTFIHVRTL
jgi:hypothetical protein